MVFGYWDFVILVVTLLGVVLWYGIHLNGHFRRHGIISAKNPYPFFGNMINVFLSKEHILQAVYRAYSQHPNERYLGFYAFNTPSVIIKDLDLVKKIAVKDFDHFLDHKVFMDEDADPLFGKNLFFLKGQKWREMRVAMSPAYTGSKMKNMFPFVLECAEQTTNHFKNDALKELKNSGKEYVQVEMKDVFSRFTNDVIASTAFGVKVNSLKEKENEFYLMGKKATDFSGVQFLKFFGYSSCPKIMKFFGITLFPENVKRFFRNVVRESMESRETLGSVRQDMIHLLMLAKKGSLSYDINYQDVSDFDRYKDSIGKEVYAKREWSHDDLTAQALAFVLAGLDTSSTLLCFTAFELAMNPDIQKRLQDEIDDVTTHTEGKLNYGELNKMKYMDAVISESLRMWPPDSQLERVCTKSYDLPPQNDSTSTTYQIKKNDDVWISVYSIQHDPKYHQDPFKFDPERFNDENRLLMHPLSFIPFGVGPRICIGARFAVMEAKALMFFLLSHFDIVTTPKTVIPLKLAANTFTLHSENGFWLGLRPRSNK